jgi:hypothetical protein
VFSPRREFEYVLLDAMYNCYYMDNGVLKKQQLLAFNNGNKKFYLPQHPDGWQNIQISFASNNSYWMLNRTFSVPLNFITDGADILRNLRYKGKGFSEVVYVLILRNNRTSGVFEAEYYGQLDMSKASDDALRGVTINSLEGGLYSYFNTNVNSAYDIPCDESVMDAISVFNDGETLQDKYNFQFISGVAPTYLSYTLPTVFINNEGDSVGVIKGDQQVEDANSSGYVVNSSNYILQSIYGISNCRIKGTLTLVKNPANIYPSNEIYFGLTAATSLHHNTNLITFGLFQFGQTIPFDVTINLAANEKLFLIGGSDPLTPGFIQFGSSSFSISFNTRNTTSTLFARRAIAVGQALVDKMTNTTGVYSFQSNFLTANNNVVLTCGDAIRQTDHAVVPIYYMSLSMSDFFSLYSAIYDMGFKIVDKTLYLEKKSDLSNIAGGIIFDLGEVAGLTLDCAEDLLFKQFNCGYPDQNYDQNAGKYEYNSTQQYGAPTTATTTVLDITSKIRADGRGIEGIRGALLNKDTTDNSGDKQPFAIDIADAALNLTYTAAQAVPQTYTGTNWITFDNDSNGPVIYFIRAANNYTFYFNQNYQKTNINLLLRVDNGGHEIQAILFKNGQSIAIYQGTDTDGATAINLNASNIVFNYNDNIEIRIIPFDAGFQTYTVNNANLQVDFIVPVYPLYRETYTAISGVIDNSVYNARISPHMQLRNWGAYIKSVFYQQQTDTLTFNTGQKNVLFSRTVNGVTITENSNEIIGHLPGDPFFIPYIAKVLYRTPYTFAQQMSLVQAGYITMTFNGVRVNVLPIGQSNTKPMTNEPQQGSFLLAANNSLDTLLLLDQFSLTIQTGQNIMYISAYNPVQFVRYNVSPQAKYQYKEMYDDWSFQRFNNFYKQPFYFQKWQTSDTINLQILTSGEGQLELFIYDEKGLQVSNTPFNIITNSAVPSPFILQQLAFTLTAGVYLFVIKNGAGENIAVSEWQWVKTVWKNTHLYEYNNSYNKRNTFFNTWGDVMIRLEGQLMPADPDADFTEFTDEEGDAVMVHDNPFQKQKLYVGDNLGIPDYLAMKMNLITLLDNLLIEGIAYARDKDSKLENVGFRAGYPFSQYQTTVRKAINELGLLITTDQDVSDNLATSFMIDQQAFGMNGAGNINVTITNT